MCDLRKKENHEKHEKTRNIKLWKQLNYIQKNVIIKSEATEAVFKNTDRSIIILWTKFFMF